MAKDMNKVTLSGRLGRDVELRVTPNGRSVATFTVASGRSIKEGDAWKDQTEWFRVVAWEKLAETCANYLHKGSHVLLEGRLQTREWQDKEGQKRSTTEVIASEMYLLDKRQESGGADSWDNAPAAPASNNRSRPASRPSAGYDDEMEPEDIPF